MDILIAVLILAGAGGALALVGFLLGQRELGDAFNVGLVFGLLVLAAYALSNWLGLEGWLGHIMLALGGVIAVATIIDSARNGLRKWRDRRYLGA